MSVVCVAKIISGGQTGADRAALDFAIERDILDGDWCPKGRLVADDPIDTRHHRRNALRRSGFSPDEQETVFWDGAVDRERRAGAGG
jgi:hypothetical protein